MKVARGAMSINKPHRTGNVFLQRLPCSPVDALYVRPISNCVRPHADLQANRAPKVQLINFVQSALTENYGFSTTVCTYPAALEQLLCFQ